MRSLTNAQGHGLGQGKGASDPTCSMDRATLLITSQSGCSTATGWEARLRDLGSCISRSNLTQLQVNLAYLGQSVGGGKGGKGGKGRLGQVSR